MTSIKVNFYYIKSDFKILVTKLCEKLIKERYKVLIKVGSKKEQEELDDYLWSYEEYSFLPHRTSLDAFDNDEKIIILNGDEEETFLESGFNTIIISPSVIANKIIGSYNQFFFCYLTERNDYENHKNKLKKTRFNVKFLIEEKNQKWKIY